MIALLNIAESGGIWEAVIKIATPLNLAAFALAVVLFIVLKSRGRKVSPAVWIVIVLLVAIPIGASIYGEIIARTSIYRVRVTVVDPQGVPVEDARVWSSFGGEPKKVMGGWQFDIPGASRPKDGNLIIYASKDNDWLTGRTSLILDSDSNPAIAVNLKHDKTARMRGQVVNGRNQPVAGARVFVDGYESEAVITNDRGDFELPAHAAVNEQVLLRAEKSAYQPTSLYHPAGSEAAILTLNKSELR
jgi:hypothetical protein